MKARSSLVTPVQTTDLPRIEDISRRRLISGALASALLIACGGDDEDEPAAADSGADTTWHFEDDRGVSITLPKRPERVVAQVTAAASLWNYGVRPIAVWGNQRNADGTPNVEVGNVDLDAVESVGEALGDFDLEKLAYLQPDLIVSLYYSGDSVWFIQPDTIDRVTQIAPVAAIKVQNVPIDQPIERFAALSALLGADPNSPTNRDARQSFERAVDDLKAAIAEKPGLKVMVVAGGESILYVANPAVVTDLMYFKALGLDLVSPPVESFWENLSWEQANRYPVDLILTDSRPSTLQPDQLMTKETWRALPAVQAGQVAPWPWKTYSHLSYTKALQDLTAIIRSARADIV